MKISFDGKVAEGKLRLYDQESFIQHVKRLDGKPIRLSLENANKRSNEQIHVFSKGSKLNMLWREVKQDGKKPYRIWEIRQALFDDNGRKAEAQVKPDILGDKEARESVMKDMENLMYVCLKAAQKVVEEYNASNPDGLPNEYLSKEDIRTVGISLFIELRKRF